MYASKKQQIGAATLFSAVMLVVVASIAGIYTSRSVLFEQKDSNNLYWGAAAQQVAMSGLEHGIAWVKGRSISGTAIAWEAASDSACPEGYNSALYECFDASSQVSNAVPDYPDYSDYTVSMKVARSKITLPLTVLVQSTASNRSNNSSATVEEQIYVTGLGPPGDEASPYTTTANMAIGGNNPPLVLNGCPSGFTGNPDICPLNATGSPCSTDDGPICICTDRGTCTGTCSCGGDCTNGCSSACLGTGTCTCSCGVGIAMSSLRVPDFNDNGVINQYDIDQCFDLDHLDIHDGTVERDPNAGPAGADCDPNAAWNAIFGTIPKAEMERISDAQAALGLNQNTNPKRTVYWVDSSSNWHDDLGTADNPVVLIFSAAACAGDCPKINGNPTIYGTIYLDTQCVDTRANGWGGAEIHGSVVVESGMDELNANTEIHYFKNALGALPRRPPIVPAAVDPDGDGDFDTQPEEIKRVSGSWRDFIGTP